MVSSGHDPWEHIVDLVRLEAVGTRNVVTRLLNVLDKIGAEKLTTKEFVATYDQVRILSIPGCSKVTIAVLVAVLKTRGLVLPIRGRGLPREQDERAAALVRARKQAS